ncbi:MAG: M67 family metallopeptidase [Candidatus Omnitrophica bacterium]|nr:M67 family metallopeptidase [Candidatus Omnitrophota bacterium]
MLKIAKAIHAEMVDHAKGVYPQEACGFLAGKDGEAKYYLPIENMDHSTVTYTMDPKQQLKAFKRISGDGLELLGIFHSHVASAAEPSQTDRQMAFYPDVSYLIVSLADMNHPDLKSFRIQGDAVTAEEIVIL